MDPAVVAVVLIAAFSYGKGIAVVARRHPSNRWPGRRSWLWFAGLAVVLLALGSPLSAGDDRLFSLHMVEHVLIVMVAVPLLLGGAPVTLALRSLPAGGRRALQRVLGSRILGIVTHPLVAWLVFAAVMWGTHFSGLFEASLRSAPVHEFEHALYFVAAGLFWWPVLGADPGPNRMSHPLRAAYLFLAMPQNTFLSLALFNAATVRYPTYARQPGALADQHLAGGIMWVAGDVTFLVALLVVVALWMRHEDRMTVLLDAELDAAEAQRATRRSAAMAMKSSPR
jgi:putative copper resistance protein D